MLLQIYASCKRDINLHSALDIVVNRVLYWYYWTAGLWESLTSGLETPVRHGWFIGRTVWHNWDRMYLSSSDFFYLSRYLSLAGFSLTGFSLARLSMTGFSVTGVFNDWFCFSRTGLWITFIYWLAFQWLLLINWFFSDWVFSDWCFQWLLFNDLFFNDWFFNDFYSSTCFSMTGFSRTGWLFNDWFFNPS